MERLIHRYEIVRKLATGGTADVLFAWQWGDGGFACPAVIKRLHAHLTERQVMVEDFKNEAALLAALAVPGVPRVLDMRQSEGRWYIALEHVPGITLDTFAKQNQGPLALAHSLSVVIGLCTILDDVHALEDEHGDERGVVHGDVTPGNVIVGPRGQITLIDFGLAGDKKHRRARTGPEFGIRGTVGYFAPEIAKSGPLADRRADIFSIGALLYGLTVGEAPFPRESVPYVNAVLANTRPQPSEFRDDYPAELETIVLECLARDPKERPRTAGAVADALISFASKQELPVGKHSLGRFVRSVYREKTPTRGASPFGPSGQEAQKDNAREPKSPDVKPGVSSESLSETSDGQSALPEESVERPTVTGSRHQPNGTLSLEQKPTLPVQKTKKRPRSQAPTLPPTNAAKESASTTGDNTVGDNTVGDNTVADNTVDADSAFMLDVQSKSWPSKKSRVSRSGFGERVLLDEASESYSEEMDALDALDALEVLDIADLLDSDPPASDGDTESQLSKEERDDLLADLALFAPETPAQPKPPKPAKRPSPPTLPPLPRPPTSQRRTSPARPTPKAAEKPVIAAPAAKPSPDGFYIFVSDDDGH